ncbi:acyl-[ACP]--phospholipid O-acyltransferase [Microvirga sp. W0021]|uniref:Acyl-[ACP]--phospholipid O-acyltransferase n=1 Tax=Hohaiivirga grylli TaxID=3133970 RepID=A0ABV0BEU8_9HYPH
MFSSLMTSRRFAPLFWCQFFSAFNDNFLKNALVMLIMYKLSSESGPVLVILAGAIFIAPSFFLSGLGGQWADRYDKAIVARRLKFVEIAVAFIAVIGFLVYAEHITLFGMALPPLPFLFTALFGFGTISALFGPIKYGILPDHLKQSELPAGNALVEGATFLAILGGTILGGMAITIDGGAADNSASTFATFIALFIMGFAVLCWISSMFIPKTGEAAPYLKVDRNVLRSTSDLLKDLHRNKRLWNGGLIVSWFWLIGAVLLSLLPVIAKDYFNGQEEVTTALLTIFAISIAIGSGIASWLASGRIIMLPTAVAGLLMGVFCFDLAMVLYFHQPSLTPLSWKQFLFSVDGMHAAIDMAGLAIAGGIYIVPAFAAVQAWADADKRARVIAATNIQSAAAMVIGAIVVAVLEQLLGGTASTAEVTRSSISLPVILTLLGIASLFVGVVIFRNSPTNPLADFLSILFRAIYRVEVHGRENLDKVGERAIIALNHVSFLDAALALSLFNKAPLFAIDYNIAKRWWVKPFLKLVNAYPLDPAKPMATRALINEVSSGKTLVIFPEGRLTVTGSLMKVYDGVGLIADKSEAEVVPVKIDGLEKTFFSRLTRQQVRRRWWPKVTVTILEPVRLSVPEEIKGRERRKQAGIHLYQIMSDLLFKTAHIDQTIYEAVVKAADEHGKGRIAVEDPLSGSMSYRKLLIAASLIGKKIMPKTKTGEAVAVLLPGASGTAATILGLMSAGRVPAMLNFTAGPANLESACKTADVKIVLTARSFIEKARLEKVISLLEQNFTILYLEDVAKQITTADKLQMLFHYHKPLVTRSANDPAAILFTSGSEGAPKGVVLSHRNILANAAQAAARIDFGRQDKVFNVLPLFHSFGLTAALILPLVYGVPVYLYPSPLHYRIIPEMVYGTNATVVFGTDTFLAGYAKKAHPYDFRSIRYIVAGAEPVRESTRQVYMEKFGLRILEGYGVTETAPVLALNTPMFNHYGTVGRILPGMNYRLEPVAGIEEGGRLFVKGPNVMLGYLRPEQPGVIDPPPEGWHDTGDICTIDEDGFVTIKGRAKRFAKIGGEMVSLAAVEALAAQLWTGAQSAAANLPDTKKGERIVIMTTEKDATREALQKFAKQQGAPELMIPADVKTVDAIPLLGSGKPDFKAIGDLAAKLFA